MYFQNPDTEWVWATNQNEGSDLHGIENGIDESWRFAYALHMYIMGQLGLFDIAVLYCSFDL